jgi:hypothetical protein
MKTVENRRKSGHERRGIAITVRERGASGYTTHVNQQDSIPYSIDNIA